MDHQPIEAYLEALRLIRFSGAAVPETSYYPALSNLLNEAGRTLKPRVRCIMHLKNTGGGIPDGGLFTADQFARASALEPVQGAPPSRGAIEAKPPKDDAFLTADTKQVSKYWTTYGAVLVTNFRDFVLIGKDKDGNPVKLESYRLAQNEADFWAAAATPKQTAQRLGDSFGEFLKRTLLHNAPLSAPADLAFFLASYAREAMYRIEAGHPPALEGIRKALEQGLGITFEDKRGEHFFHSTLVQTLFYGMFSAWVLWSKDNPPNKPAQFHRRDTADFLRVPILRKLFHEIAEPGQLEELGLPEVLDWACAALNRVDRASFFRTFDAGHAVQYFYEPFLQNFDPELRRELGVWYTPPEIVDYMVARVDRVLRENLNLADGLADKNVYILDPCCGTGAFLVSVVRKIAETLQAKGSDALLANDLKVAATTRVFGFELLPAPFVVAHLQMGLLLQALGAPLTGKKERAAVYLTNALTGWEPATKVKLPFKELEEERDSADRVKQDKPILVILGNPPYNSYAGISKIEEERDLSTAYRHSNNPDLPKPQGQGLNDLYIRFFRMAERRIAEKTGIGIVCFISNYSWLDGLSHPVMRERYLQAFDHIWIDCMNGDKYRTGKLTPEGDADPSVFSTEFNREGIQVGTAIALLTREQKSKGSCGINFRNLWGKNKRTDLLASLEKGNSEYQTIRPETALGLPFMPSTVGANYLSWPLLPELFPESFPGVKTSRDDALVDIDREELEQRMRQYFDPNVPIEQVFDSLGKDASRFKARETREFLLKRGFGFGKLVRYCYRPFDTRWLYWVGETKLLDEKREEYVASLATDNLCLFTTARARRDLTEPAITTAQLTDLNFMDSGARGFPMRVAVKTPQLDAATHRLNLTIAAADYVKKLGLGEGDLFFHSVATIHAPSFRSENFAALKYNWPRIPLPASAAIIKRSAGLGRRLADLLDPEAPVPAVDVQFKRIAALKTLDGKPIDPSRDLAITAGWGHAGQGGVTMPARGRADVCGTEDGITYLDIYLNDNVLWSWVPEPVWAFTLGGYQVIKKWLSYRELELLGRPLSPDEARYVTNVARRIAAILAMGQELDECYAASQSSATKQRPAS